MKTIQVTLTAKLSAHKVTFVEVEDDATDEEIRMEAWTKLDECSWIIDDEQRHKLEIHP